MVVPYILEFIVDKSDLFSRQSLKSAFVSIDTIAEFLLQKYIG